jgi:hypothetical protein
MAAPHERTERTDLLARYAQEPEMPYSGTMLKGKGNTLTRKSQ